MGRKPEAVTVEKTKIDPERLFGVEIEFFCEMDRDEVADELSCVGLEAVAEGYNHRTREHWKLVPDSSLEGSFDGYGMELVSPPLCGREGLSQLQSACDVLDWASGWTNRSCGLHVHHDAKDFDTEAWRILVKSLLKHEDTIDELVDPDRRGDDHWACHALRRRGFSVEEMFQCVDQACDVEALSGLWYSRFIKVNLEAFDVHGTVEFRQHGGTLSFRDIAAWTSLTQGFVTRAVSHAPVRLRGTERPFDSLMWTAGACAAVKHHFWGKYALEA